MTGIVMNQRTFKVELYQGDDLDRIAVLRDAASDAKPVAGQSTALEDGEYAAAAEAHDVFLAEAKGRAVGLEMKTLSRKEWRDLVVAHPPREDNAGDEVMGFNESALSEPLLLASIVSPEMSDAERQAFLDSLSDGQFQFLYREAVSFNRTVFAPKAPLLGSAPSPNSDETSDSLVV